MLTVSRKNSLLKKLYSWPVVVVLLIPVILMGVAAYGAWSKAQSTTVNLAAVASELTDLQLRESLLTEEIERLKTDHGLEAEIRSKFDLGREGEEMIVIVGGDEPVVDPPVPPPTPWWQWWRR
jgi:hypothetical protein